jgi:hypothetical protein
LSPQSLWTFKFVLSLSSFQAVGNRYAGKVYDKLLTYMGWGGMKKKLENTKERIEERGM